MRNWSSVCGRCCTGRGTGQRKRCSSFNFVVFEDKPVLPYNYPHGTRTISLDESASARNSDFDGAAPPTKKDVPNGTSFFVGRGRVARETLRFGRSYFTVRKHGSVKIYAQIYLQAPADLKSAGNRGIVHGRLQVLHVHVFLVAPLGACHVA